MARLRFQVWLDIREMQAEDLARRVGVSNQAVYRWLKHGIPRARVGDVANALNIEPSELYRFVDTNIAAELIDYSQENKSPKRSLLGRRTKVDTTAANGSSGTHADGAAAANATQEPPSLANAPSRPASHLQRIFADRRELVDRRRRQSLTLGTPSRRTSVDRRDTRYREKHNEMWWLKVDYLDGQLDEAQTSLERYDSVEDEYDEIALDESLETQLTGTDAD